MIVYTDLTERDVNRCHVFSRSNDIDCLIYNFYNKSCYGNSEKRKGDIMAFYFAL